MNSVFKYIVNNLDVSSLIRSENTTIEQNLCTSDFTSATDTASFVLKPRNLELYKTVLKTILDYRQEDKIKDVTVEIYENNKRVFKGFLDDSEIAFSSSKIPENITLSARSVITLLDRKCVQNWGLENISRVELVEKLISDSECKIPFGTSELVSTKTIRAIANQEDDGNTYRDIIDTVLYEAGGFVLVYNAEGNCFDIKAIKQEVKGNEKKVTYRVSQKLQTSNAIYDYDGIKLTYPSIATKENQNLYAQSIDLSINGAPSYDDTVQYTVGEYVTYSEKLYRCKIAITIPESFNKAKWELISGSMIIGDQVKAGEYYPEDSDIQATYEEYTVDGLDRAYITKESRLQNSDLSLIFAKDCSYNIISSPSLTPSPNLPNIDYTGIEYMPRKAWIVLKNTDTVASNVTGFSITGTIVYRSKVNTITAPVKRVDGQLVSICTNPQTYDAETITNGEDAKDFANFVYNSKKYSSTVSYWYEVEKSSKIGDVVNVIHAKTGLSIPSVVTQIIDMSAQGNVRQYKITAYSISGYQEWTDNDVKKDTTSDGEVTNDYSTPVTVTEYCYGNESKPYVELIGYDGEPIEENNTQIGYSAWTKTQLEEKEGTYIWVRIGTYTPPKTESDITSWVMYRLAGKPKEFSLQASSKTYIRNMRSPRNYNIIQLTPIMSGYTGTPTITVYKNKEYGEECEYYNWETQILTVPYYVSSGLKQIVCVYELIDGDGYEHKAYVTLTQNDLTGDIKTYTHSTEPKQAIYDSETQSYRDQDGNYLLEGDSYVLVTETMTETTDVTKDDAKTYYYLKEGVYYELSDFSTFPLFAGSKVYEKIQKSEVYSFTGSKWENLANSLNRDTYRYYDRNLVDNIANVFDIYDKNANHVEANGYDWFKQIIAQNISAIYYYVGGSIYGGCYNYKGERDSSDSKAGFYLGSDGQAKMYNVEIMGDSLIHGNTTVGGTICNTLEDIDNAVHIFETQKSTQYGVEFKAHSDLSSRSFKWQELKTALTGYYQPRMTNNTIQSLPSGAWLNNHSVSYCCYGIPGFFDKYAKVTRRVGFINQKSLYYETIYNTLKDDTYNESSKIEIPTNMPKTRWKIYLTSTEYKGRDKFCGWDYEWGKVEQVYIHNGVTNVQTVLNYKYNGTQTWIGNIYNNTIGQIVRTIQGSGSDDNGNYIIVNLYAGDVLYYRFYGSHLDRDYTHAYNGEIQIEVYDQPFKENDLNLVSTDLENTYQLITEVNQDGWCKDNRFGFVNITPPNSQTASNMSFTATVWALSSVNKYYKMVIDTLTENGANITDSKMRTLTILAELEKGKQFYSGCKNNKLVCVTVSASKAIAVLQNATNINATATYSTENYTDSYGQFEFCFKSVAQSYGAYGVNMFPLYDYEETVPTELQNAYGLLGSDSKRWKIIRTKDVVADGSITANGTNVADFGFPSNKYDALTLGASGSYYTAPANGWFCFYGYLDGTVAFNPTMLFVNTKNAMCTESRPGQKEKYVGLGIFLPVSKGDVIQCIYDASFMSGYYFRFVYANGQ